MRTQEYDLPILVRVNDLFECETSLGKASVSGVASTRNRYELLIESSVEWNRLGHALKENVPTFLRQLADEIEAQGND